MTKQPEQDKKIVIDLTITDSDSESDNDMIQLAQKCMICRKYLLQSQIVIQDPKYKNCYSHENCVNDYLRKKAKTSTTIP